MAASHTPISRLLNPLLQSFRSLSLTSSQCRSITSSSKVLRSTTISKSAPLSTRPFSSTSTSMAGAPGKGGKGKGGKSVSDQRIALIRYHMQHPLTPRPLRLSRMRALRHWTIHRAWMLARRKKLEAEELELQRYVFSISSYPFSILHTSSH